MARAHDGAMIRGFVTAILLLAAAPLRAETGCEDIWFTRNLVMDRAGYCFSTPLGRALFDNSDCIGTHVTPDPAGQALINRIRALEAQHGCRVDTSRRWLDMKDINFRKALTVLPIRDDFESGCLGWTGTTTPLYAGYFEPLHAIGQVTPGDYVSYAYLSDAPGWSYVTIHAPVWGAFKSAGWLYWPGEPPCADFAG